MRRKPRFLKRDELELIRQESQRQKKKSHLVKKNDSRRKNVSSATCEEVPLTPAALEALTVYRKHRNKKLSSSRKRQVKNRTPRFQPVTKSYFAKSSLSPVAEPAGESTSTTLQRFAIRTIARVHRTQQLQLVTKAFHSIRVVAAERKASLLSKIRERRRTEKILALFERDELLQKLCATACRCRRYNTWIAFLRWKLCWSCYRARKAEQSRASQIAARWERDEGLRRLFNAMFSFMKRSQLLSLRRACEAWRRKTLKIIVADLHSRLKKASVVARRYKCVCAIQKLAKRKRQGKEELISHAFQKLCIFSAQKTILSLREKLRESLLGRSKLQEEYNTVLSQLERHMNLEESHKEHLIKIQPHLDALQQRHKEDLANLTAREEIRRRDVASSAANLIERALADTEARMEKVEANARKQTRRSRKLEEKSRRRFMEKLAYLRSESRTEFMQQRAEHNEALKNLKISHTEVLKASELAKEEALRTLANRCDRVFKVKEQEKQEIVCEMEDATKLIETLRIELSEVKQRAAEESSNFSEMALEREKTIASATTATAKALKKATEEADTALHLKNTCREVEIAKQLEEEKAHAIESKMKSQEFQYTKALEEAVTAAESAMKAESHIIVTTLREQRNFALSELAALQQSHDLSKLEHESALQKSKKKYKKAMLGWEASRENFRMSCLFRVFMKERKRRVRLAFRKWIVYNALYLQENIIRKRVTAKEILQEKEARKKAGVTKKKRNILAQLDALINDADVEVDEKTFALKD
eukprot:g4996.t1